MTSDDVAPEPEVRLADYVGQDRTRRLVDVELALAMGEARPFPHMLLDGPPGSGKTTLARAIAFELGDPLLVIARPISPGDLVLALEGLGAGVCFIDEIHILPTATKNALLTLLLPEGYIDDVDLGHVTYPWLTVIGATTEREKLTKPLQSRFGLQPIFEDYDDDAMAMIVDQHAQRAGLAIDAPLCAALGRAAGGMPRQAAHLVARARALRAAGEDLSLAAVLDLANVEADGLRAEHLLYLRYLIDLGGRAGLTVIANRMRLHEREVADLERLLLDRHLIRFGTRGRSVTIDGRRRVDGTPARPGRGAQRAERVVA